ncbi:Glycoside hydrolase, subgroup, catalytic core [Niveomyces insectorum RCEF 264]|uniref:Glycoside hydrolase, subgroup, catalytic core n=1 Tax=Niveomyces insectorum RCEF 264 TaxID=1081102 RepID=A0A167XTA4_9HYPO|nr:Glycoside hydrolase, subgroup, catalytic core [Niveomyces insectorum RCEF 264]
MHKVTYADHYTDGSPSWNINATWLKRVSEVIDMATSRGFYVVTNMHHDSWKWADVTKSNANISMIQEKFYASWLQIGRALACKPSTVAFEPLNEPPADTAEDGAQINKLNSLFLRAMSRTGGYNSQRVVTLVGGGEDAVKTANWFVRPRNISNPWAIQYHYYSPSQDNFIFSAWGKTIWGSDADKAALASDLGMIRGNFSDVPLLIGEYGASPTNCEAAARWRYTDYLVRTARALNTTTMLWDNGADDLDRPSRRWRDATEVEIIRSASAGAINSLPDSTTDDASATQFSSAFVFHRVGEAVDEQRLPFLWNGNTLTAISVLSNDAQNAGDGQKTLRTSEDYTVAAANVTFSKHFLSSLVSSDAAPGIKANLRLDFSSGAALNLTVVQWDTPRFSSVKSKAVSGADLHIPVQYNGLHKVAAVKLVSSNGTYLIDDWTQYLGPFQQGRITYNNQWDFDEDNVIIKAAAVDAVIAETCEEMHIFRAAAVLASCIVSTNAANPRIGLNIFRTKNATTVIAIDTSQTYQTIDGFGFCEAFQRANALYNAPQPLQERILDLLFNTTTGAGFSILRIGLGSSPNSTSDHMNSIEPTPPVPLSPDSPPMYTWDHNGSNQVWMAKRAMAYGVGTFYADAWSAPGFMKTNGRDDEGGYLCGVKDASCLTGSWIAAYVDYLVQYVKDYLGEGIPLKYVGFINEPNLNKSYATMFSDGYQATEVIRPLRAALSAGNLSAVGVSCCEGQGWSMQRAMMPALHTAISNKELALVTTHAYRGHPAAPDKPLNTSLPVWITENSPIMQRLGFTDTWHRNNSENEGLTWANNLQTAFAVGNVNAYLYWIGVGPWGAEVPLIWVPPRNASTPDHGAPPFRLAATYWASAHWSRFIRPGAVRIGADLVGSGTKNTSGKVRASAYRNPDGSIVVQAINNADHGVNITFDPPKPCADHSQLVEVTSWLTDNGHHMAKSKANNQKLHALATPRSLTTFVLTYR